LGRLFLILHGLLGRGSTAVLRIAARLDAKVSTNQGSDYSEKRTQRRSHVSRIVRFEYAKKSKQAHNKYKGDGHTENSIPYQKV